jgi:Zn-dependent M28 family amino/carboxypeptidase
MDDATAEALGRAWRNDRPWRVLTRLTELESRLPGHPGEREAASIVADAFESAGVRDVRVEPFEMRTWTPGEAELVVEAPRRNVSRRFEAVAMPYSPEYEGTVPLVDVGYGTPEELAAADVDGAAALTRSGTPPGFGRHYHRLEKVGHAADAGAAAFVFANREPGQLPPTGALAFGGEAAVPGVGVSHETGEWLREYADAGADVALRVTGDTVGGRGHNVLGNLGPDTDEAVLVVAHYDAHQVGEGALDNGCGVATAVGAAEFLAAVDLRRRVRFAAVSGEELGLLGSEALAAASDSDSPSAVVNVDGAGRFRNLAALTHASSALSDVVDRVAGVVDHPVAVTDRPHPHSDHWPFLRRGTPALQLHSEKPANDGPWERGWTHTHADTRDKADPRTVREHGMLCGLLVRAVAETDLPGVDPAVVRERLVEADADEGMRAVGLWPAGWD